MGEELELGQLFMKTENGDYVPFVKIESANGLWIGDEMDEKTYNSLPKEGTISVDDLEMIDDDAIYCHWPDINTPLTLELDMRKRDCKKFLKYIQTQTNKVNRAKRHYLRLKEKARRNKLRGKFVRKDGKHESDL